MAAIAVGAALSGTTAAAAVPPNPHARGSNASLPVITSAPPTIGYGGTFVVGTPQAEDVALAFLLPEGSVVPFPVPPHPEFELSILSRGPDSITVAEPSSPAVVEPAPYLLAVAIPSLAGLLGSLPVAVNVLGSLPSPSPSAPPASGGPPGSVQSSRPAGGSRSGRTGTTGGPGVGKPSPEARGPAHSGGALGERSRIDTRRTEDRGPLARLPWLPLVLIGAFALIARKLARLT